MRARARACGPAIERVCASLVRQFVVHMSPRMDGACVTTRLCLVMQTKLLLQLHNDMRWQSGSSLDLMALSEQAARQRPRQVVDRGVFLLQKVPEGCGRLQRAFAGQACACTHMCACAHMHKCMQEPIHTQAGVPTCRCTA